MATTDESEVNIAVKQLINCSKITNGLAIGIKQSIQSIEQKDAQLCILAEDCDEPNYVAVVTGLCKSAGIPVFRFSGGQKKLGELAGLCKLDADGKARRVVRCSCAVVKGAVRDPTNVEFLKKLSVVS